MHQNYMRVRAKVETAHFYPQDAFCPIKDTVFSECGGSLFGKCGRLEALIPRE